MQHSMTIEEALKELGKRRLEISRAKTSFKLSTIIGKGGKRHDVENERFQAKANVELNMIDDRIKELQAFAEDMRHGKC